jgi:hypothetical protein
MLTDLELYTRIRYALCYIKNTKLPIEGVKDTYALCELVEERIKQLSPPDDSK